MIIREVVDWNGLVKTLAKLIRDPREEFPGRAVQPLCMSERVYELKRCIEEKYGYAVRHLAEHPVVQPLEDGERFEGVVDEFEITGGSGWPACFSWFAPAPPGGICKDWPVECYAVPKFPLITDAVAAVRWVYGLSSEHAQRERSQIGSG